MAEDVKPSQEGPRSGLVIHTHNFRGGLTIALLALVLLMSTFIVSSPTVPRILAILVAVTGVGVAAGLVPIRGPQDFYGGLVLVLLAILALVASADLPGQRGFAFGPGIHLVRNVENSGFIKSCNAGFDNARGAYIVFLNNDTEVKAGWLDELYETMQRDPHYDDVVAEVAAFLRERVSAVVGGTQGACFLPAP